MCAHEYAVTSVSLTWTYFFIASTLDQIYGHLETLNTLYSIRLIIASHQYTAAKASMGELFV